MQILASPELKVERITIENVGRQTVYQILAAAELKIGRRIENSRIIRSGNSAIVVYGWLELS